MVAVLSFLIVGVPHILHNKTCSCIASVVPRPLVVVVVDYNTFAVVVVEMK